MNSVFVVSVECQSLQIQQWAFFAGGQTDVKSIIVACVAEGCSESQSGMGKRYFLSVYDAKTFYWPTPLAMQAVNSSS